MTATSLKNLTTAALLAVSLLFGWIMWRTGGFEPGHFEADLFVFSSVLLLTAAISAARARWAPLPGTLVSIAFTVVSPFFQPFTSYHLSHPEQFTFFAGTVLLHAVGLAAGVTGLAATWQRYRPDRPLRWTGFFLTGLTGVVVGALAVGGVVAVTLRP